MSNLETKKTYGLFATATNNKLISELNKNGENLLIYPSVKTDKIELSEISRDILTNLSRFDWLVFTDVFSVDYFIESLRELGIDLFELDEFTICAFGESVADRLRFVQIHADVIPTKIDCDSVYAAISEYVPEDLMNLRFLILKQKSQNLSISGKFKSSQSKVEELPIYQATFQDEFTITKLKTLLKNGAIDEFVFSSEEDLVSLNFLFANDKLDDLFKEIKVTATTENIYKSLVENNLRPLYFHHK